MKIRFSEHVNKMPVVEIMPDGGKFDTMDGLITVYFFDFDEDGRRIYKPSVQVNVYMGSNRMEPDMVGQWADCMKAAYRTATRWIPPYIGTDGSAQIVNAFMRVKEIEAEIK